MNTTLKHLITINLLEKTETMALDERPDESSTRWPRTVIEILHDPDLQFDECAPSLRFNQTAFPLRAGLPLRPVLFRFP
jgi:hypothetical protein